MEVAKQLRRVPSGQPRRSLESWIGKDRRGNRPTSQPTRALVGGDNRWIADGGLQEQPARAPVPAGIGHRGQGKASQTGFQRRARIVTRGQGFEGQARLAIDQRPVERLLGGEMVVEDRFRYPGGSGDPGDGGGPVSVGSEEWEGGIQNGHPSLGRRKTSGS